MELWRCSCSFHQSGQNQRVTYDVNPDNNNAVGTSLALRTEPFWPQCHEGNDPDCREAPAWSAGVWSAQAVAHLQNGIFGFSHPDNPPMHGTTVTPKATQNGQQQTTANTEQWQSKKSTKSTRYDITPTSRQSKCAKITCQEKIIKKIPSPDMLVKKKIYNYKPGEEGKKIYINNWLLKAQRGL